MKKDNLNKSMHLLFDSPVLEDTQSKPITGKKKERKSYYIPVSKIKNVKVDSLKEKLKALKKENKKIMTKINKRPPVQKERATETILDTAVSQKPKTPKVYKTVTLEPIATEKLKGLITEKIKELISTDSIMDPQALLDTPRDGGSTSKPWSSFFYKTSKVLTQLFLGVTIICTCYLLTVLGLKKYGSPQPIPVSRSTWIPRAMREGWAVFRWTITNPAPKV